MEGHPKMSTAGSPKENRLPRCRPPGMRGRFLCSLLLGLGSVSGSVAWAHQVSAVGAEAKFFRDGTYVFALSLEVQASSDPVLNDQISPEQAVLNYLGTAISFLFDEQEVKPEFSKPAPSGAPPRNVRPVPTLQLYTEAKGKIPTGAQAFYTKLSPETEVAVVLLVERDGVRERRARTIFAGETCRPVDLTFLSSPRREGDVPGVEGKPSEQPGLEDSMLRRGSGWMFAGGGRAAVLLVAILLVGISLQALGMQAVVFLVAVFFGQLLFGFGSGPPKQDLGAVISALLLAGLAAHNLRASSVLTWVRYSLVSLTGLVLGIFSPGKLLPGFLAGQLLAVTGCTLLVWVVTGGFWKQPWYGSKVLRPASWLLLAVALYWLVAGVATRG